MTAKDLMTWCTLAGMLLAGGMWLGRLENRVQQIEQDQRYVYGESTKGAHR